MIRAALMYSLYRWLLFPIAFVLVHVAFPFLPDKIRRMVLERRNPSYTPLLAKPIWIHASSGEIEYAKPVIRDLKTHYPELPILVTYFSPSAKKLIEGFPGVDLVVPLPWDRPSDIEKFFDFYQPRAGLFARTDVWPTVATIAQNRKIPLLLFAATLSANSSRLGRGRAALSRWALSRLNGIFCVSQEDESNFQKIWKQLPVQVAGDTRYDQVFARLEEVSRLPSTLSPGMSDFVFVAGSTWPEDEEVVLSVLPELEKNQIRTVLVPHEVGETHLSAIEKVLQNLQLSSVRFSQAREWKKNEILLVDQVGKLADLYRWGSVAFVGGSFKAKIHSVMEPLAAGLPVLVGPFHTNNREALQFQGVRLKAGETAVAQVDNPQELLNKLLFWKKQGAAHRELSELTRLRTGASREVTVWIEKSLGLPKTGSVQNFDRSPSAR